jgi:hypothetical protein
VSETLSCAARTAAREKRARCLHDTDEGFAFRHSCSIAVQENSAGGGRAPDTLARTTRN